MTTVMVMPNPEAKAVREAHIKDSCYKRIGWMEICPSLGKLPLSLVYYVLYGYRSRPEGSWEMGQYFGSLIKAILFFDKRVRDARESNVTKGFPFVLIEYVRIYEGSSEGIYRRTPPVREWKCPDEFC